VDDLDHLALSVLVHDGDGLFGLAAVFVQVEGEERDVVQSDRVRLDSRTGKKGKMLCQVFLFNPEGENAPVLPGVKKVHQHLLHRAGEIGFHLILDDLFYLLGLRKGKGDLPDKGFGAWERGDDHLFFETLFLKKPRELFLKALRISHLYEHGFVYFRSLQADIELHRPDEAVLHLEADHILGFQKIFERIHDHLSL